MIVAVQVGDVACQITCDEVQQGAALDEMASVARVHVMACVRELAEADVDVVDGEE